MRDLGWGRKMGERSAVGWTAGELEQVGARKGARLGARVLPRWLTQDPYPYLQMSWTLALGHNTTQW